MTNKQLSAAVNIHVYHGKAYLPSFARLGRDKYAMYLVTTPVHIAGLNVADLSSAINRVREFGNPVVEPGTVPKYQAKDDIVLRAAKAPSLKRLYLEGTEYSVYWNDDEGLVTVRVFPFGQGRRNGHAAVEHTLPISSRMEEIAGIILDDVFSRPLLLEPRPIKSKKSKQPPV